MKLLVVVLGALASFSHLQAQNTYICPEGTTSETIIVNNKAKLTFKTQNGKKTPNNLDCSVNYQMGTCSRAKLACNFKMIGKGKDCPKGDKVLYTYGTTTKGYCGGKKGKKIKNNKVTQDFSLRVMTDKKKNSKGGQCSLRCVKGGNTPAPTPAPTPSPTTGGSGSNSTSPGYRQAWLRGSGPGAHVHEGVQLADRQGWVAIGELLPQEGQTAQNFKVMIRAVDNGANTLWTKKIGEDHKVSTKSSYSVGYSVVQGGDSLYAGVGLWQKSSSKQAPAVMALDRSSGSVLWTTVLGQGQSKHGGVRSCIMDGQDIVCAGYVSSGQTGFLFVADDGKPAVWRLDSTGSLLSEKILSVEGLGQLAKIRSDPAGGFVACSTGWSVVGGQDVNVVGVVKLSASLDIEWSQNYGKAGGNSQVFDMLVDGEGNYLLGGHTTVGQGVVNWDYLALKVNSQTRAVMWRKAYGQPRGFDARYIHDEMYGVALDNAGNYLLLGGSGDEYDNYNVMGSGQWSGWASDTWGSYLVVVSPSGEKLYENFYGKKGGNNAGEWLSYDKVTGNIMVYTDSDTQGGFGFLKLTPSG